MTPAQLAPDGALCAALGALAALLIHHSHHTPARPTAGHTAGSQHQEEPMDRIYTNRLPGQERIHIEIAANEVADLLDDLPEENPEWFDATKKLRALLVQADKDFHRARWDAAAAEQSR